MKTFVYKLIFSASQFLDPNYCHPSIHVACYVINWLSVIADPIIYAATQERYRFALKLLYLRVKFITRPERYNQEFRRPSYHLSQIRSNASGTDGD